MLKTIFLLRIEVNLNGIQTLHVLLNKTLNT